MVYRYVCNGFLRQIRLRSYQSALPVPRILVLCNHLQNVVATTYIFRLQLSTFIFYNKHLYTKIYGRMPTDDFLLYVECDDTDLNYMLDEFYLALGQENRYSKFFHLFSIIEFVEKRYEDHNGANKLLASDEIEAITKAVMDISTMVDREKRNRVCGALKQTLGNLTDIGRKEKLVHILHQMGIREIKNCGTEFEIDDKTIGKLISLRNKCYHGDRKKADHSYINIDLAVTQLMYLCEQIIIKQMKSTHERMV